MSTAEVEGAHTARIRQSTTNQLLRAAQQAGPSERQRLIDEVIVANIDVARSVARRYRNRGIPSDDLEQVACVALVQAANQFDPAKAEDFLSYAVPTIRGEVRRYFRDQGWVVRPPRPIQELQAAIGKLAAHATHELSDDELATQLGVSPDEVRSARSAQGCFCPTSLDVPGREGGDSLGANLIDDEFDEYAAAEARTILSTLARDLKPRDRLILFLRFVEGRTQSEIGDELGVTQMQVSRLLARILGQMRERAVAASHVDVA